MLKRKEKNIEDSAPYVVVTYACGNVEVQTFFFIHFF